MELIVCHISAHEPHVKWHASFKFVSAGEADKFESAIKEKYGDFVKIEQRTKESMSIRDVNYNLGIVDRMMETIIDMS